MSLFRLVNPFIAMIAKSPIHFLISNQLLVMSFQGIKTGKNYLIPVSFHQHDETYTCATLRSNLWWKNLKNLSETQVWLRGQLMTAALEIEHSNNQVIEDSLKLLVTGNQIDAFFAKVKLNKDGNPNQEDLTSAAKLHTMIKLTRIRT